jgi:hypothetical protein
LPEKKRKIFFVSWSLFLSVWEREKTKQNSIIKPKKPQLVLCYLIVFRKEKEKQSIVSLFFETIKSRLSLEVHLCPNICFSVITQLMMREGNNIKKKK